MLFSAYGYIKFISFYHQKLLNYFPEKTIQKNQKVKLSICIGWFVELY